MTLATREDKQLAREEWAQGPIYICATSFLVLPSRVQVAMSLQAFPNVMRRRTYIRRLTRARLNGLGIRLTMKRRFAMKELIRNLSLLGILLPLFYSLPGAAQLMIDNAAALDDIPALQSSLHNAIDDSRLYSLSASSLIDSDTLDPDDDIPADFANGARTHPGFYMQPEVLAPADTKFHWRFATRESLLFTGVMHAFNLTTEAGTRDALNGPWFNNYTRSVSELRGWSDSDRFMAPYVGHTIEGSVFGYNERRNDPKYKNVQWGDGRDYFVSLLRSMAFSAVWHTQWKIGPISEASLGNVMLHASRFISLADTPTLGTVEMMGEDAADRYLLMGLENRTARVLILLARSFLNPGRTWANVMTFQVPWHRETRPGVFGNNFILRKELLAAYKTTGERPFEFAPRYSPESAANSTRVYPREAAIELTAFPYYQSFLGGGSCVGGGGSGAARVNPHWQVVAELSGCLLMHMPASNQSGDALFYGGGARWTPIASHRISPYAQLLIGGTKVSHEIDNLALKKQLLNEWNDGYGILAHYPKRSDWSVEYSNNGPSIATGGGVDFVVTRPFAWRILELEYNTRIRGCPTSAPPVLRMDSASRPPPSSASVPGSTLPGNAILVPRRRAAKFEANWAL